MCEFSGATDQSVTAWPHGPCRAGGGIVAIPWKRHHHLLWMRLMFFFLVVEQLMHMSDMIFMMYIA